MESFQQRELIGQLNNVLVPRGKVVVPSEPGEPPYYYLVQTADQKVVDEFDDLWQLWQHTCVSGE